MGQLTQNFVDLAMATCKEGRHPSLTVWEAQQLLHAWNDRDALRARVAELEGDLNVTRLQLGARVCSECPARARVAEADRLLREWHHYYHNPASTDAEGTDDDTSTWLAGLPGNKSPGNEEGTRNG